MITPGTLVSITSWKNKPWPLFNSTGLSLVIDAGWYTSLLLVDAVEDISTLSSVLPVDCSETFRPASQFFMVTE